MLESSTRSPSHEGLFLERRFLWCLFRPLREQARSHRRTHSNVGAGLLAKAPAHSIGSLAEPPLSQASPHTGIFSERNSCERTGTNVGASLLAMESAQSQLFSRQKKTPDKPAVYRGFFSKRLAAPTHSAYWQASQSGSSIAQAFGTGAGPAGAARTESSPWLPPLETAFSLPVLMVDFSVLVAARARR